MRQGQQNNNDGLWDVPIPTNKTGQSINAHTSSEVASVIIIKDKTKTELAYYLMPVCSAHQLKYYKSKNNKSNSTQITMVPNSTRQQELQHIFIQKKQPLSIKEGISHGKFLG
eukprot:5779841-Ditylum_brightwellii.AAC.1